jgi:ribosome-associated translation inhibitor RaiA
MEEKKYIYIVLEEYNNDGDIQCNVLGVYTDIDKAQKKMEEQLENYKSFGVFEKSDFDIMIHNDDNLYVYAECDDYYGKIDIIKQEIE